MRGQSVVLRAAVEMLLHVRDAAQRAEAEKADWTAASAGAEGAVNWFMTGWELSVSLPAFFVCGRFNCICKAELLSTGLSISV